MRLMARIARHAGGVVDGSDLRKSLGLGDVRFVTADAQYRRVEFGGCHRSRIIDMFRQRSVACLAVDMRMFTALLFFQDIGMTVFASLMAGEVHRTGCHLGHGISAVVSILSETLRHKKRTYPQERQADDDGNNSHSKKMPSVFEHIHKVCFA